MSEMPWTLASLHTGVCPECHEVKFIGHGPLCSDCYLRTIPVDDEETP